MKFFLSLLNIPIGYLVPPFPSLFWPLGPEKTSFDASYLYYTYDMWKFILYWSLIMSGGFYFVTSIIAAGIQLWDRYRKTNKIDQMSLVMSLSIIAFYVLVGLFQGLVGGAVIGLIVLAIYRTGVLNMSTWIPFCWSLALVAYDICSLYLLSLIIL